MPEPASVHHTVERRGKKQFYFFYNLPWGGEEEAHEEESFFPTSLSFIVVLYQASPIILCELLDNNRELA